MSTSREAKIYLAIWRKAQTTQTEFDINLPSKALTISTRQGMYRAIKPYRNRYDKDPILAEAADKYVVTQNLETNTLRMTSRKTLEAIESQLSALGLSEADLLDPTEIRISADLQALIETPSDRSTPFYSRED